MDNSVLIRGNCQSLNLNKKEIIRIALRALEGYGFKKDIELSIFFTGKKVARDLNVRYRKMSYIPQVLGFPNNRQKDTDGMIRLGDIVICKPKLKEEKKLKENRNVGVNLILEKWIEHGIENLLK